MRTRASSWKVIDSTCPNCDRAVEAEKKRVVIDRGYSLALQSPFVAVSMVSYSVRPRFTGEFS